jgi:hypothetical protein
VTGERGSVPVMSAIDARGRLVFRLYDKRITSVEVVEFLGQLLHHPGLARTLGNLGRLAPGWIESYTGLRVVARDDFRSPSYARGPAGRPGGDCRVL